MTPEELLELEGRRILIVATDAGAALFLAPVIKKLHTRNTVKVVAGIHGAVTFRHQDISYQAIEVGTPSEITAQSLLEEGFNSALLGTNLGRGLEKTITLMAREYGVKTMAVVDHYWHLWQRFADLEARVINHYLPDDVWVFEQWQKERLVDKGVPLGQVHVTPQPYLESIRDHYWSPEKKEFCREFGIDPQAILLTYASEPPPTGKINWESEEPSITEIQFVTSLIVETIATLISAQRSVHLVVKKHPTEPKEFLQETWSVLGDKCSVLKDYPPERLIQASDVVLGMTSMFLLESQAMGKPTVVIGRNENYYSEVLVQCNLQNFQNKVDLSNWLLKVENDKNGFE